jgi:hypothetical protein
MKRLLILSGILPLIVAPALPANAAIHEMVAAFCSGGGVGVIDANGFLEPPGVTDRSKSNFAQPSLSSGAVVRTPTGPVIGTSPAAKFPVGTSVLGPSPSLAADGPSLSDHPSAEHCAAMNPP